MSSGPSLAHHIEQNIESVAALQRRQLESVTPAQRRIERIGRFIGRPSYLVAMVALIILWVAANVAFHETGARQWDPPPFEFLDSIMTFISLVTTTIILVAQNRQTHAEQQHAHLDLQVNLLTEQKVTKLIHLMEELRRDMPMVKDRHDAQATALQESAKTADVVSAIDEVGLARGASHHRID